MGAKKWSKSIFLRLWNSRTLEWAATLAVLRDLDLDFYNISVSCKN